MFTGIVTHLGTVVEVTPHAQGLHLALDVVPPLARAGVGDSVAVKGVCLTVTSVADVGRGARYTFDAVPETLRCSNLGVLRTGDQVHLEASLRVGDALGGHWVTGHVDGTGEVVEVARTGNGDVRLLLALPDRLAGDVIPKGSVTIDGVSLTVGEVEVRGGTTCCSCYLIPHTLLVTTLGRLVPGALVNLEMDVLGRWVAHHLGRQGRQTGR